MITNRYLWRCWILLVVFGCGMSLVRAGDIPNPLPSSEVVQQTLPNGLRLVVREDHSLPTVAMVVVVRGGSAVDGDTHGAGHYLEHLLFQGTKQYPERLMPQFVLENAGGVSDAVTSRDMTRIQATVGSDRLNLLVDVLADIVLAPTLDEESFQRERATVLAEIQREGDTPLSALINAGYWYSYRMHPYRFRPAGSIDDILTLKWSDIRTRYRRWFVPNNMSVVLVGDVTPVQARTLVDAAFGTAKSAALPSLPLAETTGGATIRGEIARPFASTYQLLAFPAPASSDFVTTAALDVLMAMLVDGEEALLPAWWEKSGIAVINFGGEYISSQQPGRFMLWANTDPNTAVALRKSTLALLRELSTNGAIPEELLARAKQRCAARFLLENETYSQQAATLAFYEGVGGAQYAMRYVPTVQGITRTQLRAAIPVKLLSWVVMGKKPEEEP